MDVALPPRLAPSLLHLDAAPRPPRPGGPPSPARARLDPVPAHEPDLRVAGPAQVAEARDVRSRGPAPVDVLVFESRNGAARARLGDVVHHVVADLAARIGEAGRETRAR